MLRYYLISILITEFFFVAHGCSGSASVLLDFTKLGVDVVQRKAKVEEYGYEHFPKACVNGENIVKYPNLSVDDCKIKCNEREDCVAFEYGVVYGGSGNYNPRDCNLQSGSDKSGCDAGHHNLDLYVKKERRMNENENKNNFWKAITAWNPWPTNSNSEPVCPREKGFCLTSNGRDQNSGVIKLNSLDGDTVSRQEQCLKACRSVAGVTGCEVIWSQNNRGCYAHTQNVARGNGENRHYCWPFSKCQEENFGECSNGDVKLEKDGTPLIFWNLQWMPICGHYFWDNQYGVNLFCKKLGYDSGSFSGRDAGQKYYKESFRIGKCTSGDRLESCTGGCNDYRKGGECSNNNQAKCYKTSGAKMTIKCSGGSNHQTTSCFDMD